MREILLLNKVVFMRGRVSPHGDLKGRHIILSGFMGMRMALHFTSLFPAYPPRIYVTEPFAKYVCVTLC